MTIKLGVIGTGHLGKFHVKLSKLLKDGELVGIYDQNKEQAAKICEEFGTTSFDDINELIKKVDAVIIVATTSAHYEVCKMALEAGKHVFVEKPITSTIQEAEEIVAIAKKMNLKLQVGHIERFNPALVSLEKYNLEPKFIQTDRLAQFNPRGTDVAVVLDLMIHDIDIILSLVKSEVKDIMASGIAVVSDSIDIANARIEFENGAVANVTASRISQKKMRKMRMFQRDTYLALDFNTGESEVFRLTDPEKNISESFFALGEMGVGDKKKLLVYEQPQKLELNAMQHELQLFVNAIVNDEEPVVTGNDGLRALKIADIILKKIEESAKKIKSEA
ncbi:MAG: Gfo/Idh/MocA family oxidoreductase [Melioribacteraceae bacterium]|nr:Gfo/Idh/MocA family oxidoreductase [Melioribacteraceae bacterium]